MGLRIIDVSYSYDGGDKVLDGISLDVNKGEIVSILGRSGSGKTTLLNIIAGFLKTLKGRVTINGVDVNALLPGERNVGMVFQDLALFPHMTVRQNIEFPLRARKMNGIDIRKRADDVQKMLGIGKLSERNVTRLSGGERQRTALARALVYRPSVLLMDEPLSSLDPTMKDDLRRDILRILKMTGTTTLFVTHDRTEALSISDRICVIDGGKVIEDGLPAKIFWRPGSLSGADFMGVCGPIRIVDRDNGWASTPYGRIPDPGPDATHIGFRPESISFESCGDSISMRGIVREWEFVGGHYLLGIETVLGTIRAPFNRGIDPGLDMTFFIRFRDLIPLK
ncbi:MAG: ABC transporter ATP-binding protein [Candidatus Thermoplasmatota archaeon]|nr:ABC transporter ATP-binding protein [Candidatus Thermoplasmatota archaeon]